MALPGSSTISFADINTELGRSSSAEIEIPLAENGFYVAINQTSTSKPNGSTPNAINEWYSYNHTAIGFTWTYTETGGANGEMRIYVNSVVVETRTNTSSGTYTGLESGDTIYVVIELLSSCSGNDDVGNVYTQSNKGALEDADCFTASTGTLTTATYTVVAGDVGTTITLDTYASCEAACL